jgi:hypothetical protein
MHDARALRRRYVRRAPLQHAASHARTHTPVPPPPLLSLLPLPPPPPPPQHCHRTAGAATAATVTRRRRHRHHMRTRVAACAGAGAARQGGARDGVAGAIQEGDSQAALHAPQRVCGRQDGPRRGQDSTDRKAGGFQSPPVVCGCEGKRQCTNVWVRETQGAAARLMLQRVFCVVCLGFPCLLMLLLCCALPTAV